MGDDLERYAFIIQSIFSVVKVVHLFYVNRLTQIPCRQLLLEKGTNRKEFVEGIVNKYEWQSLGSSYVLSDLQKAFLYGQLRNIKDISKRRRNICEKV